jgi:hypothetical protein
MPLTVDVLVGMGDDRDKTTQSMLAAVAAQKPSATHRSD